MTATEDGVAVDPGTDRFWSGVRQGVLDVPRCDDCGALIWYPRAQCPQCMSSSLTWERLSGLGQVYSFTVNRRGQGTYRGSPPFVIAYVELDEGPRVMCHVVGVDVDAVRIGDRVRQARSPEAEPGGRDLLRFEPVGP